MTSQHIDDLNLIYSAVNKNDDAYLALYLRVRNLAYRTLAKSAASSSEYESLSHLALVEALHKADFDMLKKS